MNEEEKKQVLIKEIVEVLNGIENVAMIDYFNKFIKDAVTRWK